MNNTFLGYMCGCESCAGKLITCERVLRMSRYYNMTSLLWKGANLEMAMGSKAFLWLVAVSLVLSHVYVVVISYIAATMFEYYEPMQMCAVGFSAVLFALKYVWNHMAPQNQHIMGMSVPAKYAACKPL